MTRRGNAGDTEPPRGATGGEGRPLCGRTPCPSAKRWAGGYAARRASEASPGNTSRAIIRTRAKPELCVSAPPGARYKRAKRALEAEQTNKKKKEKTKEKKNKPRKTKTDRLEKEFKSGLKKRSKKD